MFARALLCILLSTALAGLSACEKVDHDSVDKWTRTEKGPDKLKKALADNDLEPDLAAHVAVNLIKPPVSLDKEALDQLEKMPAPRRAQVIAKLAPRLWQVARIENEKVLPNAAHTAAKDALFAIRAWAEEPVKQQIDGYMIDWYGVASYEGRANAGQYPGVVVVRAVGPAFAKKLSDVLNGLIAAPGQEKSKYRIGDELMLALAASGSPDAVKKLLDVAGMDRGDETLAPRAFSALYKAYINPAGLFDLRTPEPLQPNLETIVRFAKDDSQKPRLVNDAVELIRAVGEPGCFDHLIGMVSTPHRESLFKYVAANNALRCGGPKSIAKVVRALPDSGAYVKDELVGAVAGEIAKMNPRAQVLAQLRELVEDKSTIARWTAIEALAAMKSVEDRPRIEALAKSKEKLVGFWGEEEGKQDPTLGERAKELAAQLGGGK